MVYRYADLLQQVTKPKRRYDPKTALPPKNDWFLGIHELDNNNNNNNM